MRGGRGEGGRGRGTKRDRARIPTERINSLKPCYGLIVGGAS